MKKTKNKMVKAPSAHSLFGRVVSILEQARANVVRSVNSNMTIAYWLIGREIVQELQGGDERAEYGQRVIEDLSEKLKHRYGKGFSETNLKYFRLFYQTYAERVPEIRHNAGDELKPNQTTQKTRGVLDDMSLAIEKRDLIKGFSSLLSWSHYRALTKVEHKNERLFYEIEAEKEGWSVPVLERQIHPFLFARLLKSRDKDGVMNLLRKGYTITTPTIVDIQPSS